MLLRVVASGIESIVLELKLLAFDSAVVNGIATSVIRVFVFVIVIIIVWDRANVAVRIVVKENIV